ncbi:hypothetical protein BpHYR1_037064 [Brachionus plicatilis]|uniref:Uncharacterized protein n=1 Tax=Brachionus plicatilis TaxID=10195 RepID=A0A3M7QJ00_BRAPC|nr:hypothetical protein BpHYR1_037064 [Brachionus plicatilis]
MPIYLSTNILENIYIFTIVKSDTVNIDINILRCIKKFKSGEMLNIHIIKKNGHNLLPNETWSRNENS